MKKFAFLALLAAFLAAPSVKACHPQVFLSQAVVIPQPLVVQSFGVQTFGFSAFAAPVGFSSFNTFGAFPVGNTLVVQNRAFGFSSFGASVNVFNNRVVAPRRQVIRIVNR